MADLIVEHDGKRQRFDGSKAVLIGRDAAADVICSSPAVSRSHVRVTLEAGRWMVADESSLGTFIDHTKITRRAVDRPITLLLGDASTGEAIRLSVDDPFARPMRGDHETVQVSAEFADRLDALHVRVGEKTVSVRAGEELTVGRDASNDLVVDDPIVSRQHVRIAQRGDRWVLSDVGSSRGTFVNGGRVPQHDLVGKGSAHLGDPSGPEVSWSLGERERTSAVTVKKRTLKVLVPAVIVGLLVVAGLVKVFFGGGSDEPGLTRAKQASVWLEVSYPGRDAVTGSGTILTKDGVILTSAHVVAQDAAGLPPSYDPGSIEASPARSQPPTRIVVYTYVSDDVLERSYLAQTLVSDGYLDLAVIKVNSTADGAALESEELDLPHTGLGDSDEVATGEAMTVLGFPDLEHANSVTVAPETVTGTARDDPDRLIEEPRAWILGQSQKVTHGSSGGALVDASGHVVGVTTEVFEKPTQVRYRPSAFAQPLVDAAMKDPGSYPPYQYVKQKVAGMSVELRGASRTTDCPKNPQDPVIVHRTTGVPFVCLDYTGVQPGQAIYVSVSEQEDGEPISGAWQLFASDARETGTAAWPTGVPPKALSNQDLTIVWVQVFAGPNFEQLEPLDGPFPIWLT